MKLNRIEIKNFRSIKDETIYFDKNALILLGKNEVGKSNILKAIAAVFGEYVVSSQDKRKRIDNEIISEYFVKAIFDIDTNSIQKFFKQNFNIESPEQNIREEYLHLLLHNNTIQIQIQLKIGNNEIPEIIYDKEVEDFFISLLSQDVFMHFDNDVNQSEFVNKYVEAYFYSNQYNCIYWQYNGDNILPDGVRIADFTNRPHEFKALENIFQLCNRGDIRQEFQNAIELDGDYHGMLEQISIQTTQTFREIWKDFADTSMELKDSGEYIRIKISNKAKYTFEDRSDGFKKYMSILLMLSTKYRSKNLSNNSIILIDEPDQSLYPTSARYLRDELLRISDTAYVVYSTHSQYMIDSDCIDRHLIVLKNDDVTTVNKVDENSPFNDDELLRRAIGTSIFECLKSKNIVFEGWLDKQLFTKYCEFNKKEKEFKKYGITYMKGISGIETIIPILILANKEFIVVADSDETSNNKRSDFEKSYEEYKSNWLAYSDIIPTTSTMEDFLELDYLKVQLAEFGHQTYHDNKTAIQNIDKIANTDKNLKQKIKNQLVANLKPKSIKKDYGLFVDELLSKLK